jgi:IS1 family transposase
MNTPLDKAVKVIELVVEGCSVSTIERVTGVHHTTILRLLAFVGEKCERILENKIRAIPVSEVQCDELWGFVGCKEKRNLTGDPERGDAYCFVAIERHSKLILSWHLGRRTARDTDTFIEKLNEATAGRFQLTTDGFRAYTDAVHYSLGTRVDYAQLVKVYAAPSDGERNYSPSEVVDAVPVPIGKPSFQQDLHISRRTPKPHDANADSPIDPTDKRFLQEAGESPRDAGPLFLLVQLLPDAQILAHDSGDGCGNYGDYMDAPSDGRSRIERMHDLRQRPPPRIPAWKSGGEAPPPERRAK